MKKKRREGKKADGSERDPAETLLAEVFVLSLPSSDFPGVPVPD